MPLAVWTIVFACGLLLPSAQAQPTANTDHGAAGSWLGTLDTGVFKLRLLVKIAGKPDALTATLDSLDQNTTGIPISTMTFQNDVLHFEASALHATFDGQCSADGNHIVGTWKQGAGSLPLTLDRTATAPPPQRRPQEPKPPYPYATQDVTFPSTDRSVTLAGTLTLPTGQGPFPAVLLVAGGSGPQDRNEEIFGHKLFLVLADFLTRRGIAVLRYDKRGIGQSSGEYAKATSADFTDDALSAVQFLKTMPTINPRQIGMIGHSEGGLIAPLAATRSQDVAFIVLMAGPGLTGEQILLRQSALIQRGMGVSEEVIRQNQAISEKTYAILRTEPDDASARRKLDAQIAAATASLPAETREASRRNAEAQIDTLFSPWFRFFMTYDPRPTLRRVRCPVLALNGSHDLQVPSQEDLAAIAAALKAGGNSDRTVREMPGLNHLFQTCQTGLPSEYAAIEETISPAALQVIGTWIGKHTTLAMAESTKRRH